MTRVLLAGASFETVALARDLGNEVVAVADPTCQQDRWRGIAAFDSDDAAISAGGFQAVVIAIDEPRMRQYTQIRYQKSGVAIANLLGSGPGDNTKYGAGLVIQRLARLSVDCRLGDGVRLNFGALVIHNAVIGDYVTIAPQALILSHVTIGSLCYIGSNATILPGITIGQECTVGAGAVVTTDVPDGQTVKGIPAR